MHARQLVRTHTLKLLRLVSSPRGLVSSCLLAAELFAVLLASLSASPATVRAQQVRQPNANAAFIMVPVFRSADKTLGPQAATAMRSRIDQDFPSKEVWVVPVEQINGQLTASGFSITAPLQPYDATELAKRLRAGEYIDGSATRTATGIKVEANLVLTRDSKLVQPLGTFEAPKLDGALQQLSKELREARKQLDGERKCFNAARESKYAEAAAAARAGIALYPKSTLARICLANVLDASKAPADSLIRVTREILSVDPKSVHGLRLAAKAFRASNQQDSAVVTLTRLMMSDPSDTRGIVDYVYQISELANPEKARPIIDTAVKMNPGDTELLKLRWLILFAVRDYKEMFTQGDELVRIDTAFADTTYFYRTALAYAADSAPQKAAEFAARGVAKFPDNATLVGLEIQALQKAGQTQQALDKLDKAEERKIAVEGAGNLRITFLRALGRNDEVLPVIRRLVAAGDTTTGLRQFVIAQGGDERTKGQAGKDTAMLAKSLATLAYGDSISKGAEKALAQFQMGAASVVMAQLKVGFAQADKSCQLMKEAKNHLVDAQIQLPKGGSSNPDIMRTLMTAAMQLDQGVDSELKRLNCK